MPDVVAAVEQNLGGNDSQAPPAKPAKKGPTPIPMSGIKFRMTDFRDTGGSTGRIADTRRQEMRSTVEVGKVEVSQAVFDQYTKFLGEYVDRLIKAQERNPDLLRNEQHANDRDLLTVLAPNNEKDPQKIDQNIRQFLQRPEGWMIATQTLEQQTAIQLFALGLRAGIEPVNRDRIAQILSFRLNIDREILDRLFARYIDPYLGEIQAAAGGRWPGAEGVRRWQIITGTLAASGGLAGILGPLFGVPGAIVGAATPPVIDALVHFFGRGVHVDTRQSAAALQMLQANTPQAVAERAFLWETAGIDVEDFEVQNGQIVPRQTGIQRTTRNFADIEGELIGNLYTRFQFLKEIGVPEKDIDILPEQFLLDPDLRGAALRIEQTGLNYEKRLVERFNVNGGGIRDAAGRNAGDPNFLAGGATLDVRGNLERFTAARRETIAELISQYITENEIKRPIPAKDAVSAVAEQIAAREAGGRIRSEREKTHEDLKEALNGGKGAITNEQTAVIDPYKAALTTLEQAREEARRAFNVMDVVGIDAAIAERNRMLKDPAFPNSIEADTRVLEARINQEITQETNAVRQRMQRAKPESVQAEIDTAIAGIKRSHQYEKEQLEARKSQIQGEADRLNTLRNNIENARKTLAAETELARRTTETLTSYRTDYERVSAWANLNMNALVTQPIDQILVRINAANAAAPPPAPGAPRVGWPAEDNGKPENMTVVIQAIIEARTRDIGGDLSGDFITLTSQNFNLSEVDLIRLTPAEILTRVNDTVARGLRIPLPPGVVPNTQARVEAVIQEIRRRSTARFTAITETLETVNKTIQAEEKAIQEIDLKGEISKYKLVQELMSQWSEMSRRALQIRGDADRYVDRTAVDPNNPTLTAAEKGRYDVNGNLLPAGVAGNTLSNGYLELTNILFGYQSKPDSHQREEKFKQIISFLPPEKLAEVLREALGIRVQPAPRAGRQQLSNIDYLLTQIQNNYNNGTIRAFDIQQGLTNMINTLAARAALGNII